MDEKWKKKTTNLIKKSRNSLQERNNHKIFWNWLIKDHLDMIPQSDLDNHIY